MSPETGCTSCNSTERLHTGGEQGVQPALSQSLRGRQEVAGHEVRVKLPGAPHRHIRRCASNPDDKAFNILRNGQTHMKKRRRKLCKNCQMSQLRPE